MGKITRTTCLITSFNYKNYVGEAIESALSQTHPFDEIIVVDDASPDGSGEMLQDCYGQNPNVKIIIHAQNQGEIAATTTGFLQSTGDIIFFLDSDDIYHPQYLETALSIYNENPVCDFIFCQLGRFQSTKEAYQPPTQSQISQYKDYIKDRGYSLILTAEEHIFVGGPTSGNSIRRKYLDKILPCNYVGDYRIYADNCVVLGSSILGARKFCLDIPLVGYRKHGKNESHNIFYLDRFRLYQNEITTVRLIKFLSEKTHLDLAQASRFAPYEFKTIDYPTWGLFFTYVKIMLRNPSSVPFAPWPWSKLYGFTIMLKHLLSRTSKNQADAKARANNKMQSNSDKSTV